MYLMYIHVSMLHSFTAQDLFMQTCLHTTDEYLITKKEVTHRNSLTVQKFTMLSNNHKTHWYCLLTRHTKEWKRVITRSRSGLFAQTEFIELQLNCLLFCLIFPPHPHVNSWSLPAIYIQRYSNRIVAVSSRNTQEGGSLWQAYLWESNFFPYTWQVLS